MAGLTTTTVVRQAGRQAGRQAARQLNVGRLRAEEEQ
jgi:hypothetical protein